MGVYKWLNNQWENPPPLPQSANSQEPQPNPQKALSSDNVILAAIQAMDTKLENFTKGISEKIDGINSELNGKLDHVTGKLYSKRD